MTDLATLIRESNLENATRNEWRTKIQYIFGDVSMNLEEAVRTYGGNVSEWPEMKIRGDEND